MTSLERASNNKALRDGRCDMKSTDALVTANLVWRSQYELSAAETYEMGLFRKGGRAAVTEAPLDTGDCAALVAGFLAKVRADHTETRQLSDKDLVILLALAAKHVFETNGDFQHACHLLATDVTMDLIKPEPLFSTSRGGLEAGPGAIVSGCGPAVTYSIQQGLTPDLVVVGANGLGLLSPQ